jgi:hypothetical protein
MSLDCTHVIIPVSEIYKGMLKEMDSYQILFPKEGLKVDLVNVLYERITRNTETNRVFGEFILIFSIKLYRIPINKTVRIFNYTIFIV